MLTLVVSGDAGVEEMDTLDRGEVRMNMKLLNCPDCNLQREVNLFAAAISGGPACHW